ncbi:MAG: class I SAM-dependent methyltransferase [Treponema sp.]|nr:class I SAM-dependent methyltransferase [Treponema sp.]MCL2237664.1 class I SAM-dependent methyltransferase [Treponema sp.]
MQDKTSDQAQMLFNRLQKRFRHLKKWAQRTGTGAFRLYDRDIPEIPLVLDFYGECEKTQDAAICGSLYKRPYEKDEADESVWLCAMKESVSSALGIKLENVFLKQRQKQRGLLQYEKMGKAQFVKIVYENGLSFKTNLSDYLDTGLFIDRRLLRAMVRDASNNKKVLNLFSYTGSFSVYAAAGGAASTDSVDLSNTYLNWAKENFSLNGFSANLNKTSRQDAKTQSCNSDSYRNQHVLIKADVLEFIKSAIAGKKRWDVIIVDPPAFSNSKSMTDNFDLNRDLTNLLSQCLKLLVPNGKIFASVNVKRAALQAQELEEKLRSFDKINVRVTDLKSKIEDEDFRGRKTSKASPVAFLVEII